METTYSSREINGHTVTIEYGYEASYCATIVPESSRGTATIHYGANDTADDWAEAWIKVDGKLAYVLCGDYSPSETRTEDAWDAFAELDEERYIDDNDIIESITGNDLELALKEAESQYETAQREAHIDALANAIEVDGWRPFYQDGDFANNGTLILVTDGAEPPEEYADADAVTPREWAEQYHRYDDDPTTDDYQTLVVIQ